MLSKNTMVNLERALTLQSRLGGHLVQGHVNGIGMVSKWISRGKNYFLEIEVPQDLFSYCIWEGSIAIDGISLTIAQLFSSSIGINVIPHTVTNTTLHFIKIGKKVNIEVDVIARYVEKFVQHSHKSGLNQHKLNEWGY
jgi:riboflavin synthase